jgi:CRP/FNR family cyclic AMP-dependent transcriptional regulator
MLERFEGSDGRRLKIEAFTAQKIVAGNAALAGELADISEFREVAVGQEIIVQNEGDNDVYFIVTGNFSVKVNGREVARRGTNDHVGEMAAIEPSQRRSATIVATESSVVARITEPQFDSLGSRYPQIYKHVAKERSRRLMQRNRLVRNSHDKIRIFVICSTEALPVARLVGRSFSHDPFDVIIWSEGVFKVTSYTLQTLEDEVDKADFAIAIAHADDVSTCRGMDWPVPRDNVVFELGLFMGRLGRQRAILMENREDKVKLPSDMAGVTTISYRYQPGADELALIAPACDELRSYVKTLGPDKD